MSELLWLGLAWLGYFILHSLLASLQIKRRVAAHYPHAMPYYRLGFNLVAVLLALPLVWLTLRIPGDPLWAWRGGWAWLANGVAGAALVLFAYSLRFYDTAEFLGLRQWRERESAVEDQERFRLSPLHRYVRHPWYFLGLLLLWSRDMPPGMLLSSALATLYFIVGSRMEERKLLVYYGEAYAAYRRRVPGLLPLPWRHLGADEAAALERRANARR